MNQNNVNVTSNENPAETTLNKVSVIMCRQDLPGNLIKAR